MWRKAVYMVDQDYEAIRKVAEKRVKNRQEFYHHLAAYVVINAMLLIAFRGQWWVIFPLFGWGLGLITHGLEVFLDDPLRRERAIAREMEKLGYKASEPEKPKRERVMLSDDGELIYEHEQASESQEDARKQSDIGS
jgi:hypothetical protein